MPAAATDNDATPLSLSLPASLELSPPEVSLLGGGRFVVSLDTTMCLRARFARTLPSRLPNGVVKLLVEYCLRVR